VHIEYVCNIYAYNVQCSVSDNLPELKSRYICVIECRKKIRSGNGERGTRFENVETTDGREEILNVSIVIYRSSGDNVAEDIFLLQVREVPWRNLVCLRKEDFNFDENIWLSM